MKKLQIRTWFLAVFLAVPVLAAPPTPSAEAGAKPDKKKPAVSKEIYREIRTVIEKNFVDQKQITSQKLDSIAAEGLLESFGDSVKILTPEEARKEGQDLRPVIAAKAVIPSFIGYIRFNRFDSKTAETLWQVIDEMESKDHISGLILDLRFLKSDDYEAAAKIASLFLPADLEIFSWEKESKDRPVRTVAIKDRRTLPLVVLINQATEGAAEVLAGVLKEHGKAVLVGRSPTAGRAFKTADHKLSDGRILRYATEKVKLSKGGILFLKGITPDVSPEFSADQEREIFSKPFEPPVEFPELPFINEAILTGKKMSPLPIDVEKQRKERQTPSSNDDIALQRAIDVLKGIRTLGLS